MPYSIIKCGSAARGDANECSDEDYVCLHDNRDIPIKILKIKYPGISFLSSESIRRMKEKGSLFLVHLDVDGYVVEGDLGLLSAISNFRPKQPDLEKSIIASIDFIRGINWFPASRDGELWLLDILYVSLRNIIYCRNALRSVYLFGLLEAMNSYGLSQSDQELFLKIRQGKYAFRSGRRVKYKIDIEDPEILSTFTTKICKVPTIFSRGGFTDWDRDWKYDYWEERLIERAIINNEIKDDGFRDRLKDHSYHRRTISKEVKMRVLKAQLEQSIMRSRWDR